MPSGRASGMRFTPCYTLLHFSFDHNAYRIVFLQILKAGLCDGHAQASAKHCKLIFKGKCQFSFVRPDILICNACGPSGTMYKAY